MGRFGIWSRSASARPPRPAGGKRGRSDIALAVLMIAVMLVGISIPTIQLAAVDPPADGDDRWQPGYEDYTWFRPNTFYHDDQGNFTTHSPHQRTFSLPMNVDLRGREGDSGHIANGIMWLNYRNGYWDSVAQAERVYVKLALNEATASIASNTCRISIATQWLREGENPALSSSYSYMEFDIWHNPGWRPEYHGTAINWYAPDFWMPTIEIKYDQMEVGTTKEYIIEAKSYFEKYYPGVRANMTAAYIVVCKVFTDGWLDVNLDILDIAISSDPCLVEPEIPPLFPEGRLTGILGLFSKTFLYAKEAVVLGRPLSSGWSPGLDLTAG